MKNFNEYINETSKMDRIDANIDKLNKKYPDQQVGYRYTNTPYDKVDVNKDYADKDGIIYTIGSEDIRIDDEKLK